MTESHTIQDRFGRTITYLRVSVTDRCNMQCIYCGPRKFDFLPAAEILTLEEIATVVRVAVSHGIRKIRLTGGEPLARPNIVKLVRDIAPLDGLDDFALTTNGLLLSDFAAPLKEAGLRRINISLDTLDPSRFKNICGHGDLTKVLAGIAAANTAGLIPVKVNVVVMRGINHDELSSFVKFSIDTGVTIRFIEYMPFDKDRKSFREFMPRSEILSAISAYLADDDMNAGKVSREPATYYSLKGGGQVGIISPVSHSFCSECNRLRLTPDGSLRGCLLSEERVDLKSILRSGADDEKIIGAFKKAAGTKGEKGNFDNVESPMHKIGG